MRVKELRYLSPVWFVRKSLDFMQGHNKLRVLLYMPVAYIKFCYYMIFD